jgi:hypothetical protein
LNVLAPTGQRNVAVPVEVPNTMAALHCPR